MISNLCKRYVLLSIGALLLLTACGGGGSGSTTTTTTTAGGGGGGVTGVLKLTAGNNWSYNVTNLFPGNALMPSNNGTKVRTMSAPAGVITLTDVETLAVGPVTTTPYIFTVAANGDVSITDNMGNTGMYLPASATTVGTSWTYAGGTATVISTTATINVPAGTFTNCIQVDVTSAVGTATWYLSPTVGNYVQHIMTSGVNTHQEDLTAYNAL